MKTITCTFGDTIAKAIVDDEDFDRLIRYSWYVAAVNGRIKYVKRWGSIIKDGKTNIYMHHEVLRTKPRKDLVVDHIDRNPLNNQKGNLRLVTKRTNARNTSTYKGRAKHYSGGYWQVSMTFRSKEAAQKAHEILEEYRLTLPGEE